MKINWGPQTFRWFEAASAYTGYSDRMAALLLKNLSTRGALIDIGCGMAMSDFALAPSMQSITCVDQDARAIGYVQERIQAEKRTNMEAFCMDGARITGQWDHVICLFHGDLDTIIKTYLPLARESLIAVVHARRTGNIAPKGYEVHKCSSIEETSRYLTEKGLQYTLYEGALEYGQPLHDTEEGERFLSAYAKPGTPRAVLAAELEKRLETTGRDDFPYYLPSLKEFGLYTIRR